MDFLPLHCFKRGEIHLISLMNQSKDFYWMLPMLGVEQMIVILL